MKIGMFTDTWLPTVDGIVTSIQRFRTGLEAQGHEVHIFAPESKNGKLPDDKNIHYFKARTFKQYEDYRMAYMPTKGKNELIEELGIEILHNHGLAFMGVKAMFSARQLNIPILLHFHTWVTDATQYYPFNIREEVLQKATWRYLRSLCQRSDGVVAPSEAAINELKSKIPKMKYTNFVAPGVDFDTFNPDVKGEGVRAKYGLEEADLLVHVGRVSLEKKLELVFEALPSVKKKKPKTKLMIVGSGPALEHYKELAVKMGIHDDVLFTGFVPGEELAAYYTAGDAFVIASSFETLGLVTVEALACGLPVAGLNFRVIPEIVQDGKNGYLFEFNSKDCASKMLMALDAPDEMRNNAHQSVQRFESQKCTKKLVDIYNR